MSAYTKKISMSLPVELVSEMDQICRVCNISRSSLVTALVSDRVSGIHELVESVRPTPFKSGDSQRRKSESDQRAFQRLNSLLNVLGMESDATIQ